MAFRATITVIRAEADTKYVSPSASINNVNAEAIAFVNPDSKNQWFYDTYALGDVNVLLINKNLSETIPLADDSSWNFNKGAIETLALVESFVKAVTYNRSFTDAFTLDDLSQIDKDFYGNKGNVAFITDIIGLDHNKVLVDSYTVSDVVSITLAFVRAFSDSATLSDGINYDYNKSNTDTFSLSEQQSTSVSKQEADSVIYNDYATLDSSLDKTDSINIVELIGFSVHHPTVDSYAITDIRDVHPNLIKSDSIGFSDTYIRNIMKGLSDGFTLDDTARVDKSVGSTKGNVFGFNDEFLRSVSFNRAYAESIGLSELFEKNVDYIRAHADSYSVSDVSDVHLTKIFTDSFTVFDDFITPINTFLLNESVLNEGESRTTLNVDLNRPESLILNEIIGLTHSKNETDLDTYRRFWVTIRKNFY